MNPIDEVVGEARAYLEDCDAAWLAALTPGEPPLTCTTWAELRECLVRISVVRTYAKGQGTVPLPLALLFDVLGECASRCAQLQLEALLEDLPPSAQGHVAANRGPGGVAGGLVGQGRRNR